MTRNELKALYFQWMCEMISSVKSQRYQKLLHHLFNTDFTYAIPLDGNRASDGEDMRYRFGEENRIAGPIIAASIDDRPCSVLEMMTALSIRCEEHIMDDPEIGNRTGQWFWAMLENLDLTDMTDGNFDPQYVNDILHRFLYREYDRHGTGGLFVVRHPLHDMRATEIWYQMMWYLDEVYRKKR